MKTIFVVLLLFATLISNAQFRTNIAKPFELAVSEGNVHGYSTIDKFGVNPLVETTTTPEDVWEFGGVYNYDTDSTAPIKYISSSDALDVGQSIIVQGLDFEGYLVSQVAVTNGQNNVTLNDSLWRVFRMFNNSSVGNSLTGILYCHTDPTPTNGVPSNLNVRAIIDDGNNQTLMSLYTIPRGYVGFLYRGEIGIGTEGNVNGLNEYAHIHYESRRYGKVFTVKKSLDLIVTSGYFQDERSFPDVIPALTDIRIRVISVSENMGLWATFDIMLVDEKMLNREFLESIGQPFLD